MKSIKSIGLMLTAALLMNVSFAQKNEKTVEEYEQAQQNYLTNTTHTETTNTKIPSTFFSSGHTNLTAIQIFYNKNPQCFDHITQILLG